LLEILFKEFTQTSVLEWAGFIASVVYVLLAAQQHISCWIFAIISSFIYIFLFFDVNLYIDSGLQSFYLIMAFVGWANWNQRSKIKLNFWSLKKHLKLFGINVLAGLVIAFFFDKYTDQAYPYVDSMVFCFSISATYLITQKVIENWIYFVVIDFVAAFIYWNRDLHLTAILFIFYTILAVYGFFQWKKMFNLEIKTK
jgi:nicotinamide mononucleotide transporter